MICLFVQNNTGFRMIFESCLYQFYFEAKVYFETMKVLFFHACRAGFTFFNYNKSKSSTGRKTSYVHFVPEYVICY